MANEMDELLAQLKAEYQPKQKATRAKSQSTPPPKSSSPTTDAEKSEFDELLADVKSEIEAETKPSTVERASINHHEPSVSETKAVDRGEFYEELRQQQQFRERQAAARQQQEAETAAKKEQNTEN